MAAITVTAAGRNLIRTGSWLPTYVAVGTSSTPPTTSDTQLGAESFRKAVTTYTNGGTGEVLVSMYMAPSDDVGDNIQEVGFIGGASATSNPNTGVLIAHGLYSHASKSNTESIQFTLDFTIS